MIRAALPVTVRDSARALTLPYLIHTMYDLPLGKLPYSARIERQVALILHLKLSARINTDPTTKYT